MSYLIKYLTKVDQYLSLITLQEQRKILRQLKYLQEYGLRPEVLNLKKLRGYEFWEVRILGKHNTRIFCYQYSNIVYILHIFRKSSQKTQPKDLTIGQKTLNSLLQNISF